jgi:hypothetical protein
MRESKGAVKLQSLCCVSSVSQCAAVVADVLITQYRPRRPRGGVEV